GDGEDDASAVGVGDSRTDRAGAKSDPGDLRPAAPPTQTRPATGAPSSPEGQDAATASDSAELSDADSTKLGRADSAEGGGSDSAADDNTEVATPDDRAGAERSSARRDRPKERPRKRRGNRNRDRPEPDSESEAERSESEDEDRDKDTDEYVERDLFRTKE
ncbi:MAG: hypothetical protein AAGC55_25195, partial [Myxococcota bacterium]